MPEVIALYIVRTAGGAPELCSEIELEAGRGIRGDRYYQSQNPLLPASENRRKEDLSLIASEHIDDFNSKQNLNLSYGDLRRNVITRGIDLNALVGKTFQIGDIELLGMELCEPCSQLARIVCSKVLPHLVHRAGLRVAVLNDGTIHRGSAITI